MLFALLQGLVEFALETRAQGAVVRGKLVDDGLFFRQSDLERLELLPDPIVLIYGLLLLLRRGRSSRALGRAVVQLILYTATTTTRKRGQAGFLGSTLAYLQPRKLHPLECHLRLH